MLLGLVIAGAVGAVAVLVDFYSEVSARFSAVTVRRAGIAIWPPALTFFLVSWSLVCVGFAWFIFTSPGWAERAFNIKIDENLTEAGFVIGCSAMLLIRSQLGKVGNFNLGFEFPYALTRDIVIEEWHKRRMDARDRLLGEERIFQRDAATYPQYGQSLHVFLRSRADALAPALKDTALRELQSIEAKGDLEGPPSRKALAGFAIDYFGAGQLAAWATDKNRGNNDPNL